MTQLSIVIPVYNCEESRLRRCMGSFDHAPENTEIIVINDGSDEATGRVLENCASLNPRIRLISQNNQGVSAARNLGIEKACGKWVAFCDADDTIDMNAIMSAVSTAEQSSADLVYSDFFKVTANKEGRVMLEEHGSAEQYAKYLLCDPAGYGTVWAKLFRREVLINRNIRFRKDLSHAEDSVFLIDFLTQITAVQLTHDPYYTYYVYETSAAKKNQGAVTAYLRSLNQIRDVISAEYPELSAEAGNFCDINLLIIMVNYIFVKNRKLSEGIKMMKELRENYVAESSLSEYNRQMMPFKNRAALWLIRNRQYYLCGALAAFRRISR